MKVGNSAKGKTQVTLTTALTDDFLIQMDFHKDQAHLSEETALKESILNSSHAADDIVVFDKGLKSRKTFKELSYSVILDLLDSPDGILWFKQTMKNFIQRE